MRAIRMLAAPISEVAVVDGDTTDVLRTASYVLRARSRDRLRARRTLDDAAWRYRWLLGTTPPLVELRLESTDARRPTNVGAPSVALRAARAWVAAGRAPWWFEAGVQRLLVGTDVRPTVLRRTGAVRDAAQGASLLLFLRERDPDALPALEAAWRTWQRRESARAHELDGVLAAHERVREHGTRDHRRRRAARGSWRTGSRAGPRAGPPRP